MVDMGRGPQTEVEKIVASLRDRILEGRLDPGEQLPTVPDLSNTHGVSLNTARQALAVLASQGLITVRRGAAGGSFVTVPSHQQISDAWQTGLALMSQNAHVSQSSLLEMREILEVSAAELAAYRRTEADILHLRSTLYDPKVSDLDTISRLNQEFHTGILTATQNPLFVLVAAPVRTVLQATLERSSAPASFWRQVNEDHREILGYVEARDQTGAREAAHAHLRAIRRVDGS